MKITNANSTTDSSSASKISSFQAAVKKFSKTYSSTGFFPSFTYHDPNFRPKFKRTHSHARLTPIHQENINLSKQFHEQLNSSSSYPIEYYNFNHGKLNYWYSFDTPKEIQLCFKPNYQMKPFVPHPHMHTDYPKTFLATPHIKNCNNYMLPTYSNRKESISFEDHATICSTDITEEDCAGFVGCLLLNVEKKI